MYSGGENSELGEEELTQPTKMGKCLICTRKVMTFLLSHVGLISLVTSYCVLGAITFEGLEKQHELDVKKNVSQVRAEVSKYLWDMTQESSLIKPEEWKKNAAIRLQTFEMDLIRLMKKRGWDGSESNATQQWTFSGALFYSIVLVTTIGYGNLAPKTDWGKIVTIFYAILGIPMMLLCLSNIGDFMANAFRILYWKVCCYACNRQAARFAGPPHMSRIKSFRYPTNRGGIIRRSKRAHLRHASQRSSDSAYSEAVIQSTSDPHFRRVHSSEDFRRNHRRGGGGGHSHLSTGSFRSHRSPSPRASTLKPGSGRRRAPNYRTSRSAEPNILPIPSNLPVLCNKYAEDETVDECRKSARGSYIQPIVLEQFELDEFFPEETEYLWEEEVRKRPVPIWLCTLLVISYILSGAAIFSNWEKWTFLDSAYFCFVTLTTIGFGDYVPLSGHSREEANVEASIALCSLYLLFGISLLAMSFNLVQEEVISSVKRVASRLGIIKEENGT